MKDSLNASSMQNDPGGRGRAAGLYCKLKNDLTFRLIESKKRKIAFHASLTFLSIPRRAAMTKAEIVEDIASKTGLTKKDVATAMDQFLECISKALADGKHYEIRGFGTFKVKDRKARMARNPRTGDAVPVPDRKVPVFKVSKELKDMVSNA
jgi:nucleoid DNA-binding protein